MTAKTSSDRRCGPLAFLSCLLFLLGIGAQAQELSFHADPSRSHVDYVLGDVLHTVHGTFRLKDGSVQLDPASGKATGSIIVDATSGDSGNETRDRKMNKEILESAKYPEFQFTLQSMQGALSPNGSSEVKLSGTMRVHGADHPLTVSVPVAIAAGQVTTDVHFVVPYVQWGMKDPSTFLLRVGKEVDITVHLVGSLGSHPGS
jgi:polyisoprenoid-binding protein YceI